LATYKRPDDAYDLIRRLGGVDLTLEERAVLLGQYAYADKDGTNSRASEDSLAEYLAISVRTLRRHRKTLQTKGWLVLRGRGRNTGGSPRASTFEVVIPTHQEPVSRRPRKRPANPTGRNQWTTRGQICPAAQEVTSGQNPWAQEDKFDHLPKGPKIDDDNPSNQSEWVTTREAAPGAARVQHSCGNEAKSGEDIGAPLGRHVKRSDFVSELCPDCGCNTRDPWESHTRMCSHYANV
jgi:hypothetical protein